jgi:hypothetical protein
MSLHEHHELVHTCGFPITVQTYMQRRWPSAIILHHVMSPPHIMNRVCGKHERHHHPFTLPIARPDVCIVLRSRATHQHLLTCIQGSKPDPSYMQSLHKPCPRPG